jgi:predicted RNA-binding protein with PUA-like domain
MVDIKAKERFAHALTLTELRTVPGLEKMELLRKGSRLSVQPVSKKEWDIVYELGTRVGRAASPRRRR